MPDTTPPFATQIELSAVTARVEIIEGRVEHHHSLMSTISETLQRNSQMAQDNNSLLHKVLNVVQGQLDPGLNRPGLTDDVKAQAVTIASLTALVHELIADNATRKGWRTGAAAVATVIVSALAVYLYGPIHNLLEFANHLPPAK